MRLRTRLFLLVAGTVIPLVVLAIVLGALLVAHERKIFRQSAIDRNRAFMSAVDAELRGHISTLQALANSDSLRMSDLASFHDDAVRVLRSQVNWQDVILSAPDGRELVNGRTAWGAPLPEETDAESIVRTVRSGAPTVGRVTLRALLNAYGIAVRVPVVEHGNVVYVVSAIVDPRQFERLIETQHLPDGWVSGLVDPTGHFIARIPRLSNAAVASKDFLAAVAGSPEGWYRGHTVEGRDTFTAHMTSGMSHWNIGLAIPTQIIYASATRAAWLLAFGTLATLAVALAFAYWMSRRIALPIASLASAARGLGSASAAPRVEHLGAIEEVRDVAHALAEAGHAIAERESLLQREQDALKAADRAKDEFLAMLGHELRNPLSAISTSAHVLGAAPPGGEMDRRARAVIERQARQMTRLIEDLLDISRLTMGKVVLAPERFDLAELAERLVETWEQSGRVPPGRIAFRAEQAWVHADRARMEQVLANLLDNANKFTPPGKRIRVDVRSEGGQSVLEVSDDGDGIAPELIGEVFKLFVQAPQGPDRHGGGMGLGLSLVRRLVELHGGTVEARSEGTGKGATFTVRMAAADGATAHPYPAGAMLTPRDGLRILLVEDNADARETLQALLALRGHEVHGASTAQTAIDEAVRLRPDVILLDIGLPDMNGYEVAARLRGDSRTSAVKLVALTGYGQVQDERQAYEAGFDLHLTKPIDPDGLDRCLALFPRAPVPG